MELACSNLLYSIDRATESPSTEAHELITRLVYGAYGMPSASDVDRLALRVDDAVTEHGLTLPELRRHAQATINRVKAPDAGGRVVP